jgi:hypothetical protein
MAKRPQDMSLDELAQEMNKREDSLDHLTAKGDHPPSNRSTVGCHEGHH